MRRDPSRQRRRSQLESEVPVEFPRPAEDRLRWLGAETNGGLRRPGRLEGHGGELLSGEVDGGSFPRDLGLQLGALSAAAEAAEAAEVLLGGAEALLGGLERLLTLASEALMGAARAFAWSRSRPRERQLLGGGSLERFGEASGGMALVERAPVGTPLSGGATLPLDGALITTTGISGNPSAIAERMEGKSVDVLAAILARTPPDPIAAKYFHLHPDKRWRTVLRHKPGS